MDGKIQYDNLKYAKLDTNWLLNELNKSGNSKPKLIFLAELNSSGELSISLNEEIKTSPDII